MLYIEDLKSAYKIKKFITDTEREISALTKKINEADSNEAAKRATDKKDMLELRLSLRYEKLSQVEEFIESCDDCYLSQAMKHRFLNGENWTKVAASLGGYISSECARKMVERYLKKMGVGRKPE